MDISAIVAAAVGGAIGGAAGALIATLVGRLFPERWRRGIVAIASVALALIGSRVAVAYYDQTRASTSAIEAEMLSDPESGDLFRAWKDAEPASFAAFVARISGGAKAGRNRTTVVNAARSSMMNAVKPRVAHLNDEQVVELVRVSRDQFRELSHSHPGSCRPLFLGADFGDITPYLSSGVRQREVALLEAAFRVDLNTSPAVMTGSALDDAISKLLDATGNLVGDDVSLLANGADIRGREQRYCEVVATLYDQMAGMPASDAAALMRGLRAAS